MVSVDERHEDQEQEVTQNIIESGRGGAVADGVFKGIALASGLLVLVILVLIAVSTTQEAWPAFTDQGWYFVFGDVWNPPANEFGALPFIYGTIVTSIIALVLAVPASIGIAVYVNEVAPLRLRNTVITILDLLAAVPSVVFGLWGVLVLAPWIVNIYQWIADVVSPIPVLNALFSADNVQGKSFMTAGIILAFMITPIITSVTREVFATVPAVDKEGALALGATRWEMVRGAIFPYSTGGMVGAVLLGLGRAMGETIAVALVIGANPQIVANLFAPGYAMAAVIANQFGEASGTFRAALIGLGVLLFGITIIVNVGARAVVARSDRKHGRV